MGLDDVLKSGLYRLYEFNDRDKHLREAGFSCQQLFQDKDLAPVLKRIKKNNPPGHDIAKFAILSAKDVIVDHQKIEPYTFALYVQIEGRFFSIFDK